MLKKALVLSVLAGYLIAPHFAKAEEFLQEMAAQREAQINLDCSLYQPGSDLDVTCHSCEEAGDTWNATFARCQPAVVIDERRPVIIRDGHRFDHREDHRDDHRRDDHRDDHRRR